MVAAVLAVVGHLFAALLYMGTGLAAPFWVVGLLLVWWLVLSFIGVRLVIRSSCWVILVPVITVATQVVVMWVGQYVLGWMP
jgi:hypothetical protein